MCLGVIVYLECQEQSAQGEDEKDGENFAAEGEKTRARIRAAVCVFGIHNGHTITRCHTLRKKKVSHGANFFLPLLFGRFRFVLRQGFSHPRMCQLD